MRSFTPVADNGGMTPSAWINGGAGVTIDWAVVESALGPMLLAATDKAICRLSFDETESTLKRRFPNATLLSNTKVLCSRLTF